MNFLKRAVTSVVRRPGKSIILLLLVFVLGSIISGALSVTRAVGNTEANLRRNMRPIVSIEHDWEAFWSDLDASGESFVEPDGITPDMVREVGALPYVSHFDFSVMTGVTSFDLEEWMPGMEDGTISWGGMPEGEPGWFNLRGTANTEPLSIREGLIELVQGEVFSEEHLNGDSYVALVSSEFAELNDLSIGSTFTVDNIIFDHVNDDMWSLDVDDRFADENIFAQESYEFEVIGLFEFANSDVQDADDWQAQERLRDFANRIYVPNAVAESAWRFHMDEHMDMIEQNDLAEEWGIDLDREQNLEITSIFVLEDPLMIDDFRAEVEPMLDGFWSVTDLSNTFSDISTSMQTLQQIAGWVLGVSIGATLLILSLLITLFLRDRKHEMGVYLALGEKKTKIISQIILEVTVTAVIGITLAVFVGNFASAGMSRSMLRNDLAADDDWMSGGVVTIGGNSLEGMGFAQEMSIEDMVDAYDVSLDAMTIVLFYAIGLGAVVGSTIVPVMYVVTLNPKKVLM